MLIKPSHSGQKRTAINSLLELVKQTVNIQLGWNVERVVISLSDSYRQFGIGV